MNYFYFLYSNKSASDKVVTQQKPKEDDKIDGFDLGVLTKDEFHKAEKVGKEYKEKMFRYKELIK